MKKRVVASILCLMLFSSAFCVAQPYDREESELDPMFGVILRQGGYSQAILNYVWNTGSLPDLFEGKCLIVPLGKGHMRHFSDFYIVNCEGEKERRKGVSWFYAAVLVWKATGHPKYIKAANKAEGVLVLAEAEKGNVDAAYEGYRALTRYLMKIYNRFGPRVYVRDDDWCSKAFVPLPWA
jgi:hypothetical protein